MSEIRPAREEDLGAVNDIYNHYVRTSHATFDLEPVTIEARLAWFEVFAAGGRHRLLVFVGGGEIAGWASSVPFRPRLAYATSVETTVYVAPGSTGRGIGVALYQALLDAVDAEDVHRAYATIALPNEPSIALHERFGFRRLATLSEPGRKFDRWIDVALFERARPR